MFGFFHGLCENLYLGKLSQILRAQSRPKSLRQQAVGLRIFKDRKFGLESVAKELKKKDLAT